jgi:DNA-binding MarR family transcriptional regulator
MTAQERLAGIMAYVQSGEPDLTNRQQAMLLLAHFSPMPYTVRGMAAELGVAKPIVTRALDTFGRLGLMRRQRDENDRRNVFAVLTDEGRSFLFRSGLVELEL